MDINVVFSGKKLIDIVKEQQSLARNSREETTGARNIGKIAKGERSKKNPEKQGTRNVLGGNSQSLVKSLIDDPAATRRKEVNVKGLGFSLSNFRAEMNSTYTYCNTRYLELYPDAPITIVETQTEYPGRWITSWNGGELETARTDLISPHCGYLLPEPLPPDHPYSIQLQRINVASDFNKDKYLHIRVEGKAERSEDWQDYINDFYGDDEPYVGGPSVFSIEYGSFLATIFSTNDHELTVGSKLTVLASSKPYYLPPRIYYVHSVLSNKVFRILLQNESFETSNNNSVSFKVDFIPSHPQIAYASILYGDHQVYVDSHLSVENSCRDAGLVNFIQSESSDENFSFTSNERYGFAIIKLAAGRNDVAIFVDSYYNAFRKGFFEFKFHLSRTPEPYFL